MYLFELVHFALLIFLCNGVKNISKSENSKLSLNNADSNYEFIGCFVSWTNIPELDRNDKNANCEQGDNIHEVITTANESCNFFCTKQEGNRNTLVLKRGNFCKCSRWELHKPEDFFQVPVEYCDFPCTSGTKECGGNFFYSVSCNYNHCSNGENCNRNQCAIPQGIQFKADFKLPNSNKMTEVFHINLKNSQIVANTYLPLVSSSLCAKYCYMWMEYNQVEVNYYASTFLNKSLSNCYCIKEHAEKTILNAEHALKFRRNYKDEDHDDIVADLETQNDNESWRISRCEYFEDYSDLSSSSCEFERDNTIPFTGLWTRCYYANRGCWIYYYPSEYDSITNFSIRYFAVGELVPGQYIFEAGQNIK